MPDMEVFWLRVAAVLYATGLLHTVYTLLRQHQTRLSRTILTLFGVGAVLHLVSIVETEVRYSHFPATNFYQSISLGAFVLAVAFLIVIWRYKLESISVFVFPLVSVMTLIGAMQGNTSRWSTPTIRGAWLTLHVILVMVGYAAMLLMAIASLLYLVQERQLKTKRRAPFFEKLPPLGTLDSLISRSMTVGFVLVTFGVITGSSWAYVEVGGRWINDPTIATSFITWLFYLTMVFMRWSAGWRGRKAAILALTVLICSAVTWVAHVGIRARYVQ